MISAYVGDADQGNACGCDLKSYVDVDAHEVQIHPNRSHVYADGARHAYVCADVVTLRDDGDEHVVRSNEAIHQSSLSQLPPRIKHQVALEEELKNR